MFLSYLIFDFIFSFCLTCLVYYESYKFYRPLYYIDKNLNKVNIHEKYDEFHPKDKLDFFNMWLNGFIFSIPKLFLSIFFAIMCKFHIQIVKLFNSEVVSDKKQWQKIKFAVTFWTTLFLRVNGIRVLYKKVKCEEIYKKYLGDDYDFSDEKYSLLISNHIGFFEVVLQMSRWGAGFIAKSEVANYIFVGPIATGINCLYIKRDNEKNRQIVFEQLEKRQREFYEGKYLPPLALFPEGTTTCGRHILKFKKGAFYALLPVKPSIINVYQESDYHLSVGGKSVRIEYLRNLTHSVECFYVIDMPVIRPTEYMYKNYSHFGKEKWEIFAEVTRKIMCEIGGFKESNMGYRDELRYVKAVKSGEYEEDNGKIQEEINMGYGLNRIFKEPDFVKNLMKGVAELGLEVEKLFNGEPQDIEGVYSNKEFYIVQTRPQV